MVFWAINFPVKNKIIMSSKVIMDKEVKVQFEYICMQLTYGMEFISEVRKGCSLLSTMYHNSG